MKAPLVEDTKEVLFQGEPVSRGIAIGKPYFFFSREEKCPVYTVDKGAVEREIHRYRKALERCRIDVERIKRKLESEGLVDPVAILETHLALLQDAMLTDQVEDEIRSSCRNAEAAFQAVIGRIEERFNAISNPFFRERFRDVKDIARRITGYLGERSGLESSLLQAPEGSILFAPELPVSGVAEESKIKAFVTTIGGATSHAAIVARAKGVPCVTSIDLTLLEHYRESLVIVDGRTGQVFVNPTKSTLAKYQKLQEQLKGFIAELSGDRSRKTETIDGHPVRLTANVEVVSEAKCVLEHKAFGVGLYRSEYLLLQHKRVPSEEEQVEVYSELALNLKGKPAVVRIFDIGGDKAQELRDFAHHQFKGLSGYRSLRFLLEEKMILRTQLRAILRASIHGQLQILLPMVAAFAELQAVKALIQELMTELDCQGIAHAKKCLIGCMIEVPAAVAIVDVLAKHSDFLSIGTNDLVQYTLVANRLEYDCEPTSSPAHPAISRMIKQIVTHANAQRIPTVVCGEMAADPRYTALLLGLGISELSVTSHALPMIKKAIRSTSLIHAIDLADQVLDLSCAVKIQHLLAEEYRKTVPEDYYHNC